MSLWERLRRAPVTALLSLLCVGVYAAMLLRGHLEPHTIGFTVGTLVRFGALDPRHAWTGQPWRILSSALVHMDPVHLGFDVWALWLLGPQLERVLSPPRMLLVVLGAQVGCSASSLLFSDLSIRGGASGIAFGLIGAALVSAARSRGQPGAFGRRELLMMSLVGLGFSLLPQIDLLGHLGGLAGGAALMAGVEPGAEHPGDRGISLAFAVLLLGLAVRLALVQPQRSNWNVVQAVVRYEAGDYKGAVPFLQKARTAHNGDFALSYIDHDLGTCLLQVGDRPHALAALRRAADEGSPAAAQLLGDNEEDPHRALQAYAQAVALDPQQQPARDALLRALYPDPGDGLPDLADLAALAHLPEDEDLAPVRLAVAAAQLKAGDRAPLTSLAVKLPEARAVLAAWDGPQGELGAARALADALRKLAPGVFRQLGASASSPAP